ncbi:hypothetical protein GCM10022198_22880 [Klugiella xanthotipulae]|uniref:signal peptidase I n=1 Tax=Klugiella xanthotipulae TaxID=244735 RepID=UPI001FE97675|nr:signal peptidase I [Klugiella xanthotipulae]
MPRILGDIGLTIAAIGGLVCIVAVIAATFFQVTLVLFQTGSMGPTIPAGSVAVVVETPASRVRVGDIVTVDRVGKLPITHRVMSITPPAAGGDTYGLTLRGDANSMDDPEPYPVTRVREVIFSVPGGAAYVSALGNPAVMGGITVIVAALMTWGLWPRGGRPSPQGSTPGTPVATRVVACVVMGLLCAASVCAASVWAAAPASAAESDTVFRGRWIVLTAVGDQQQLAQLASGSDASWQVGVDSTSTEPGILNAELMAEGPLVDRLSIRVRACDTRWVNGLCAGAAREVMGWGPLADAVAGGGIRTLVSFDSDEQRWLLFDVRTDPTAVSGDEVTLTVHAWGAGDSISGGTGAGIGGAPAGSGPQGELMGSLALTGGPPMAVVAAICSILAVLAGCVAWRGAFGHRRGGVS